MTFDPQEVERLLDESDQAATATARGEKYEELLAYVFDAVPDSLVVRNQRNYFGLSAASVGRPSIRMMPKQTQRRLNSDAGDVDGDRIERRLSRS